jgi:hypothetical protein
VLGKVTVARASYCGNMAAVGIGHAPPSDPPADLDWDLWLGPRPARPFQATIMPYKFRWWQLYSSQVANWGVHYFDLIRWLTGELAPASVSAHGGRFAVDDDRTIPDTTLAIFEHASGMLTEVALFEANGRPSWAGVPRLSCGALSARCMPANVDTRSSPSAGASSRTPIPGASPRQ